MNRSDIIEVLALLRLGRLERLEHCLAQCQPADIAAAMARMNEAEHLTVLEHLEPDQRHQVVMALDYPTWLRLIDCAGPLTVTAATAAAPACTASKAH